MGDCKDALYLMFLKWRHLTKYAQVCNEMDGDIEKVLPT